MGNCMSILPVVEYPSDTVLLRKIRHAFIKNILKITNIVAEIGWKMANG